MGPQIMKAVSLSIGYKTQIDPKGILLDFTKAKWSRTIEFLN